MKKVLNILLLVLILSALTALSIYYAYNHFHDRLNDVNLHISRDADDGFIDYDKTYNMILDICDTANNTQIRMIDVDSVVNTLMKNPWITDVDASINLDEYLDVEVTECKPVARIYNKKGKSVYVDGNGDMYPSKLLQHLILHIYTPLLRHIAKAKGITINGSTIPQSSSFIRLHDSQNHANGGCLTCTIGADQAKYTRLFHLKT